MSLKEALDPNSDMDAVDMHAKIRNANVHHSVGGDQPYAEVVKGRWHETFDEDREFGEKSIMTPVKAAGFAAVGTVLEAHGRHAAKGSEKRARKFYEANKQELQADAIKEATESGKHIEFSGAEAANVVPEEVEDEKVV